MQLHGAACLATEHVGYVAVEVNALVGELNSGPLESCSEKSASRIWREPTLSSARPGLSTTAPRSSFVSLGTLARGIFKALTDCLSEMPSAATSTSVPAAAP